MIRYVIAFVLLCGVVEARGRRHYQPSQFVGVNNMVTHIAGGGSAQQKAEIMASRNYCGHIGGGFGGGCYEGVGMSSTRDGAIRICCYWGQRQAIEIGAAQAASGMWYACVFYR